LAPKQPGIKTKQKLKKTESNIAPDVPDTMQTKEGQKCIFPLQLTPLGVHTKRIAR